MNNCGDPKAIALSSTTTALATFRSYNKGYKVYDITVMERGTWDNDDGYNPPKSITLFIDEARKLRDFLNTLDLD